jgi:hypothetical protein
MSLQQDYDHRLFPFMRRQGEQTHVTESYVSIPSALVITDNEGAIWTFGFDYNEVEWKSGNTEYDVVRNGRKTGAYARFIEFRAGKVIIFGAEGRRVWNGRQFV